MKLFYKLIIFALLFALVSPFLIKDPNGRPLWDINRWFQQAKRDTERSLDSIQQNVKQSLSGDSATKSGKKPSGLYRYRDDNGKWVYTDQKPKGDNAESVTLKEEVATMKTITLPEGFGESRSSTADVESPNLNQNGLPLTTAPLSELPKTMRNLEAIQEKFDKRQQELDQTTR